MKEQAAVAAGDRVGNVPATVVGYEEDGRARVALLEDCGRVARGEEAIARLRDGRVTSAPQDFDYLRRKGLRLGGVVMLHRVVVEEDGTVAAGRIEMLRRKGGLLDVRVLPRTLCSIMPPPRADTAMVEEALLAFPAEAIRVQKISSVLGDLELALEEPCLYGDGGVVLRGPLPDGRIGVHEVRPQGRRAPADVVRDLLRSVPREFLNQARKGPSEGAWEAVPTALVPVDPERQPRLSAQAANHSYRSDDGAPRFTLGTSTLRLVADAWVLADATPLHLQPRLIGYDAPGLLGTFGVARRSIPA